MSGLNTGNFIAFSINFTRFGKNARIRISRVRSDEGTRVPSLRRERGEIPSEREQNQTKKRNKGKMKLATKSRFAKTERGNEWECDVAT